MTEEVETSAPPALYDHCCRTYNAMLEESHLVQNEEQGVLVYEGFLTRLITSKLNLSVPYYTSIRNRLIEMGCIRQLKRGGGSAPSQYEMIYEPSLEAFMKAEPAKVPKASRADAADEQIRNLAMRLSELETWQEAVNDMLADFFGTEVAT